MNTGKEEAPKAPKVSKTTKTKTKKSKKTKVNESIEVTNTINQSYRIPVNGEMVILRGAHEDDGVSLISSEKWKEALKNATIQKLVDDKVLLAE